MTLVTGRPAIPPTRIHELDGALDDPPEHGRQIEVTADREDRLEELTKASGPRDIGHPVACHFAEVHSVI